MGACITVAPSHGPSYAPASAALAVAADALGDAGGATMALADDDGGAAGGATAVGAGRCSLHAASASGRRSASVRR
jgi:hypothetical protein